LPRDFAIRVHKKRGGLQGAVILVAEVWLFPLESLGHEHDGPLGLLGLLDRQGILLLLDLRRLERGMESLRLVDKALSVQVIHFLADPRILVPRELVRLTWLCQICILRV